ncbi:hypothetical protein LT493_36290 [Streptomyces tricolor]|nr:hypothetical protein [Streptomyces tricolor]
MAAAALVFVTVPKAKGATDNSGVSRELKVFKKWDVLGTVLATALCSGGMFTLITYMVPLLTDVSGFADSLGAGTAHRLRRRVDRRKHDRRTAGRPRPDGQHHRPVRPADPSTCALYWLVSPVMALSGLFVFLFSVATFALIPGLQTRVLSTAAEAPNAVAHGEHVRLRCRRGRGLLVRRRGHRSRPGCPVPCRWRRPCWSRSAPWSS